MTNRRTSQCRSIARFPHFLMVLAAIAMASNAEAQPVGGFVEDWPGTSLQGWGGGSILTNPGTGGVGGAGDGFLGVESGANRHLGTVSFGTEYAGDWNAAGITAVRFWLKRTSFASTEIHFSLGNGGNFWQHNVGFIPPSAWGEFSVDLTNAGDFTQTIGSGTYEEALDSVDRVHVRHDLPPFVQIPDLVSTFGAEFGFDRFELISNALGVPPAVGALQPIELAPPRPNPSRGSVAMVMRTRSRNPFTIEIMDVTGRRVRVARFGPDAPGDRIWLWDGLDDRGASVAPGAYRVRAYGPEGGTSRSIVRIQ